MDYLISILPQLGMSLQITRKMLGLTQRDKWRTRWSSAQDNFSARKSSCFLLDRKPFKYLSALELRYCTATTKRGKLRMRKPDSQRFCRIRQALCQISCADGSQWQAESIFRGSSHAIAPVCHGHTAYRSLEGHRPGVLLLANSESCFRFLQTPHHFIPSGARARAHKADCARATSKGLTLDPTKALSVPCGDLCRPSASAIANSSYFFCVCFNHGIQIFMKLNA